MLKFLCLVVFVAIAHGAPHPSQLEPAARNVGALVPVRSPRNINEADGLTQVKEVPNTDSVALNAKSDDMEGAESHYYYPSYGYGGYGGYGGYYSYPSYGYGYQPYSGYGGYGGYSQRSYGGYYSYPSYGYGYRQYSGYGGSSGGGGGCVGGSNHGHVINDDEYIHLFHDVNPHLS
ncbi:spore coat protein YeeK-like [Anopheles albimanus]|uniref:Uncharacterized protein n=1 Tax=Anopheles albimanus TaxID=7167 RepID=A0A8W7K8T1_ANOAL|nr:spore coat protein YeeK-like [Anopheles albimanus]